MNAPHTPPAEVGPPTPLSSAPERRSPINIPNLLTSLRILAIPVVVALLMNGSSRPSANIWAAVVFGLAFLTDIADGAIARQTRQVTHLGRVLDPIADKLLVLAAVILLVHLGHLNAIVAVLLLSREMAVSGLRALAGGEGIFIKSSGIGKLKTFFEGFGLALLMMGHYCDAFGVPWFRIGQGLIIVALILALWSGFDYFRAYVRVGGSSRS